MRPSSPRGESSAGADDINGVIRRSKLLLLDALVNLSLGLLLLIFPASVVRFLGVPPVESAFYPSVLGGVLLGVGVALMVEYRWRAKGFAGLGLAGAVCINLVAGAVLAGWLFFGRLGIPARGRLFLWAIVTMLVIVSFAEIFALNCHLRGKHTECSGRSIRRWRGQGRRQPPPRPPESENRAGDRGLGRRA